MNKFVKKFVLEEYKKDPRPAAVAARFGIHYSTVKRWAAEAGLKPLTAKEISERALTAEKSGEAEASSGDAGNTKEDGGETSQELAPAVAHLDGEVDFDGSLDHTVAAYLMTLISPGSEMTESVADAVAGLRTIHKLKKYLLERKKREYEREVERTGISAAKIEMCKIQGWVDRRLEWYLSLPEEERERLVKEKEARHKRKFGGGAEEEEATE